MLKYLTLCALLFMQFTTGTAMNITINEQDTLFLHECDDYLLNKGIDGQQVLEQFREKGGIFVRVDRAPFTLLPEDRVYPICTGGFCRSQTLWMVLKDFNQLTVLPPHATRVGFDPYNNEMNWHKNDAMEQFYDEFELWAGQPKTIRFGYEVFSPWHEKESATAEELAQIKDYYDKNFFTATSQQRHVYCCFDKNTQVILQRLAQVNPTLEHVVVVHFPFKDVVTAPPAEWNTFCRSQKAHEMFSNLLKAHLDLTKLNPYLILPDPSSLVLD